MSYLSGVELSLKTLVRDELDVFYARAVYEAIVHPALVTAHTLLTYSGVDAPLDDSAFRNALLFWAQLHRMASEKQFPQDLDWDGFLQVVEPASLLASDMFYGKSA